MLIRKPGQMSNFQEHWHESMREDTTPAQEMCGKERYTSSFVSRGRRAVDKIRSYPLALAALLLESLSCFCLRGQSKQRANTPMRP